MVWRTGAGVAELESAAFCEGVDFLQQCSEGFVPPPSVMIPQGDLQEVGERDCEEENCGEYWGKTGCAFLMQNNLAQAFAAFEKFLQFSNDSSAQNPVYWYAIGVMYMEYENYDFAAKCFEGAIEMQQKSPKAVSDVRDIIFRLAVCHRESGNHTLALKYFQNVVQNPPKPLSTDDILFHIGLTYEAQRNRSEAQKFYSDILNHNPQHLIVLQQLASLCFLSSYSCPFTDCSKEIGFDHESETDCKKALESLQIVAAKLVNKSPKDRALVLYLTGRCHLILQMHSQALSSFNQAVYLEFCFLKAHPHFFKCSQLDDGCPSYWFFLGKALSITNSVST
jgi:glucose repression mediator protein